MSVTNTFAELTANGSTASYELPGDVNKLDIYLADAETWGSGTLIAQTSFDGGTTWVAVPGVSYNSGDGLLASKELAFGRDVRFTVSGATSPSLTVTIKATPVASYVEYYNLTANGNTEVPLNRPGAVAVFAKGTWDSGSLTLSHSPDGTLYLYSGVAAITADGGGEYANAADDALLRLVLASVTTAADLDVHVYVTGE